MEKSKKNSRRKFVKKLAGGSLLATAAPGIILGKSNESFLLEKKENLYEKEKFSANDTIRLGVIGTGIIAFHNIDAAMAVNGVELAAACDLYDGRLERVKEKYGDHVFTTRNYKELLDRKDIDAVLVATSDHWHDRITIDALNAGKAVYCEKPMVHKIDEGAAVISAEKKNNGILQVGSNPVSSIVVAKARELYRSGAIGQIVLAEAANDRHSSLGAWQYSIPPDASTKTVDWDAFIGDAPKVGYDSKRFFRWRNYQDYGTGIAGDLFVHLFSWLHFITDSNGPERIFASGGLRYWKDGRDVPDIMAAVVDYPEAETHPAFNFQIRVNFEAGGKGGGGWKLVGTEGSILYKGGSLELTRSKFADAPGYGGYDSLFTFPEATQKAFIEEYNRKYYNRRKSIIEPSVEFKAPEGYDSRVDHWANFVAGIRDGVKIVEDGTFGLRAAAPALAANESYFDKKIVKWDPVKMKLK